MTKKEAIDILMSATVWTDEEREALDILIPELRESEDERIRKGIVETIKQCPDTFLNPKNRDRMLAYLEKQKEQKPAEWSEEDRKHLNSVLLSLNRPFYNMNEQEKSDFSWLQSLPERFNIQPKPEWSEEDQLNLNWVIAILNGEPCDLDIQLESLISWLKSLRPQPKKGLHPGSIRKVDNPMKWMEEDEKEREQKPVAWSEDDEKMINSIINVVCGVGSQPNGLREKQVYFLKSLRPSWKPSEEKKKETLDGADIGYGLETAIDILENGFTHYQTDDGEYERKQALDVLIFLLNETHKKEDAKMWSKEDENALNYLHELIGFGFTEKFFDAQTAADMREWLNTRLKSLRPQSKDEIYKEKDEAFKLGKHQLAIRFMNYLDENRPEGKMGLSNSECEDIDKAFKENDWAKIMRYVEKYSPSWKPSEEQIYSLGTVVKGYNECAVGSVGYHLKEMYEQLKRLM